MNKFRTKLEAMGDVKAAALLKEKERTVKSWRLGVRSPRSHNASRIAKKMRLSLEDIYGA